MKIIKHCEEEGSLTSDSQGVLLGLIMDGRLEITNCFSFPRHNDEEEVDDYSEYQRLMTEKFRSMNIDHLAVGWYSSNPYGATLSKLETVDSIYMYQDNINESVILLYDQIRTQKGFLSLKAYRLTSAAMKTCQDAEFTTEALRANQVSFDNVFEEIPLKIVSSTLKKGLMLELSEQIAVDEGKQLLEMGNVSIMEKTLQGLMREVDDVNKWANYQRQIIPKQQQIQKENTIRVGKGEPPMAEDEINKIIKPLSVLQRFEAFLNYCQTLNYCRQTASYAAQNVGKLYLSKALQEDEEKPVDKD